MQISHGDTQSSSQSRQTDRQTDRQTEKIKTDRHTQLDSQ